MQDLHGKVPGGEVLGQLCVDGPVSGEQRAQPPRVAPRVPSEEAGAAVGEQEVAQEAAVPHQLVAGEVLGLQHRHHRPGQLGQDGEHGVHVPLHRKGQIMFTLGTVFLTLYAAGLASPSSAPHSYEQRSLPPSCTVISFHLTRVTRVMFHVLRLSKIYCKHSHLLLKSCT